MFPNVAAKIKDFERLNSTEFKNAPKRDIVDTNPHAYCAPGTTRTNNTVYAMMVDSGVRCCEKADGRIFEGFHYLFVPRFFLTFS